MIDIDDLTKEFRCHRAVDRVELTVPKATICVILGPSGCGKTSLLRLIAGLEEPDAGVIRIDGREVSGPKQIVIPPNQRSVGFVFQDLALWPHLHAIDNLKFGLARNGRSNNSIGGHIAELLDMMSLKHCAARYPQQLSGGERQRLAIARALAPGRRYLLMDEPFSSLDPILTAEMVELLQRLKTTFSTTVLYVTHDLDEAMMLADRIVLMNAGRIIDGLEKDAFRELAKDDLLTWYKDRILGA